MYPREMAKWVRDRKCSSCRGGLEARDHYGCKTASEIADYLDRLRRFKGTDEDGRTVRGYFVEDM